MDQAFFWHFFGCYAPTNDGDQPDKNLFYEQLQAELEEILRYDVIIVMGDMNAKVGDDNLGVERTMRRPVCGTINNNGERLVDFCADNRMVVWGTLFPHPTTHKLTWVSSNGREKNQIDNIAIKGTWRRFLLDVRVRRGGDVARIELNSGGPTVNKQGSVGSTSTN